MDSINSLATGGLGDIVSFVSNFIVLLVLAAILFFHSVRSGRATFISLVLALYAGFGLYSLFPYKAAFLNGAAGVTATATGLLIFGVLTFFPYILLRRIATSGLMHINPVIMFLLSLVTAGFILALGYHLFDLSSIIPLSAKLAAILTPDKYLFWWCVAPLAGIFLASR